MRISIVSDINVNLSLYDLINLCTITLRMIIIMRSFSTNAYLLTISPLSLYLSLFTYLFLSVAQLTCINNYIS